MVEMLAKFIDNSPFAAVLWELKEIEGEKDFYMQYFNSIANDNDRRNFSVFLDHPFKSIFPEALDLRDDFFKAIETQKTVNLNKFAHGAWREDTNYFSISVIPLDEKHIVILYQNITEEMETIEEKILKEKYLDDDIPEIENEVVHLHPNKRLKQLLVEMDKKIDKIDKFNCLLLENNNIDNPDTNKTITSLINDMSTTFNSLKNIIDRIYFS